MHKLTVVLEGKQPALYELPLAFDPWLRFSPDWSQLLSASASSNGWQWGLTDGTGVAVESSTTMQLASVLDSLNSIGQPEDPNQEHSAGHWLPFPTARLYLPAQNHIQLTISLVEEGSGN